MQCKHHVLSGKGLFSTSWQVCPQTVAPSGYHPHSYHNYRVILYQRQNYTFSQFHKPSAKIWRKRERNLLWREKILPLRRPWRFVYQWSYNCNFVCLSQKWWLEWMATMSMMMMMTGFSTGPACRTGDPESFFGDHTSYCKSYRRGNNVNHNNNVHYHQRNHHAWQC